MSITISFLRSLNKINLLFYIFYYLKKYMFFFFLNLPLGTGDVICSTAKVNANRLKNQYFIVDSENFKT